MVGTFFLTVIPGLEIAAYLELCEKWRQSPDFFSFNENPEIQIIKGGIEFDAPIDLGLKLHPYLKVPTRMLLRLASFEAPKENAFRKEIKKIEWPLFFKKGQSFDVAFTSKSSRLSMKKQMIKIFEEELRIKNEKGAPSIYIRIIKDKCNISLDCTGERAQFRGREKKVSMASLRESTAAGLLRILLQGLNEPFDIIDPMCGSGTFLSEAINLQKPMERKFAFENFPIFKKDKERKLNIEASEYFFNKAYGYDNHPKAVTLAQNNLAHEPQELWSVEHKDLYKDDYSFEAERKKIVIINPPWGKRLPANSQDIIRFVDEKLQPDRLGILIPAFWKMNSSSMERVRDVSIMNSGVENRFLLYSRYR